jgi:hypothetical protein
MKRSTFTAAAFASIILGALAPLGCGGDGGPPQTTIPGNAGAGGAAGSGPGGDASGSTGKAGSSGPSTCGVDSLTAQFAWSANDDACTVQGDLIVCSYYKFRFDGTWQKETLIADSNGVAGTCTQGSWSQTSCGVLELDDCNHTKSQLTWSVTGAGASAEATINGGHYSPQSWALSTYDFADCRPAACPDAPKNTDGFLGTWSVSENKLIENCSSGKNTPTVTDFVWQGGTTSDLEEADGPCKWQLDVLGSTFRLPASETCSDPTSGASMTYYRYDGELNTATTATLWINASVAVPASATSKAESCSVVGTLQLTKVANP